MKTIFNAPQRLAAAPFPPEAASASSSSAAAVRYAGRQRQQQPQQPLPATRKSRGREWPTLTSPLSLSRLPAFPRKQKSSQRMATAVEARATLAKSRGCTNTNAGMGMGTGMGRNRNRSRYKTSRWTHGRGSSFVERTTGRRVGLLITSTVLELLREDAVAFAGPAKRTGLSAEEIKDVLAEDLAVRQYFVRYQSHQYLPMYSPESIRTFAVTNFCTRRGLHTNSCTQNCELTPENSSVE